jgi:ribonuclease D
MKVETIDNNGIRIKLISTPSELVELTEKLKTTTAFGFDTEFDRFCREYGFKLFLLQIFDGEICYLVDPLAVKDLTQLWTVFEDSSICKVVYSSSEDIQLLKLNGCNIKNIYDLQIAAKLCNQNANSFSDLVKVMFNVELDKSMQRSNWRPRPLNTAKQIYASNDVIWLLKLKDIFNKTAKEKAVTAMIEEENILCEDVVATMYTVKLSAKQKATNSNYHQNELLKLFHLRNKFAEQYNMPPFQVVADGTLEEIIENKNIFLKDPFKKGYCGRLLNDEKNKQLFYDSVLSIDENIANVPAKKDYEKNGERTYYQASTKEDVENKMKKISELVISEYGENAAEYILRGLKKSLLTMPYAEIKLRNYQQQIIIETCNKLNIKL